MAPFDWRQFLQQWNEVILADPEISYEVSDEARESGWIGRPPATTAQIQAVERRLGATLPSSYTSFLKVSNGWPILPPFIEKLWSAEEVAWFRERHQDWIDVYGDDHIIIPDSQYFVYGEGQDATYFRTEYLQTCLEISDLCDGAIMLLNPNIVDDRGEWEAWFFATWKAGATRFPSFLEMMQNSWEFYKEGRLNP